MLKRTKKRQTAGALYMDMSKDVFEPVSAKDLQVEMQRDYVEQLKQSVKHAKRQFDCSSLPGHEHCHKYPAFEGSFYIVVNTKKEKVLDGFIRNQFLERQSCPTPQFDQAVYKYDAKMDEIVFMWVVPDQVTCLNIIHKKENLTQDEMVIANYIKDYYSGELLSIAMKENGEKSSSGLILEIQ